MILPITDIPDSDEVKHPGNDLTDLLQVMNSRLRDINDNFTTLGQSALTSGLQRRTSIADTPNSPYVYGNPIINVYEFLDPLFAKLRTSAQQVSEVQVLPNAVGQNQLQTDSVIARTIRAGEITADKMNVNVLSAIAANIGTITAGNITLDTAGYIRGGATTYNSGTGFWMGYDTTAYKFFLGTSAGNKITWDGTTLSITGTITGYIPVGGGAADVNANVTTISGGKITAASVTTTQIAATTITGTNINTLSISGKSVLFDTGTIGGWTLGSTSLTNASGGNTVTLSTGSTAFLAGPTGSPTVTITQAGALTATSGTIGGFTLGATTLTATGITLSASVPSITLTGSVTSVLSTTGLNLSVGTTQCGFTQIGMAIALATGDNATYSYDQLFLTSASSNSVKVTPAGVFWGISYDVNLYRNGLNVLKTDDSFECAGGIVLLNNATSNVINWSTFGAGAPAFTTRSAGTKLVLYNNIGGAAVDFGFGIESGALWSSVATTGNSFKYYGGTTLIATLSGAGLLTTSNAVMIATTTSYTNGAAGNAGTLTNAPAVGNPTKWIPINDNGTTRYIPAW